MLDAIVGALMLVGSSRDVCAFNGINVGNGNNVAIIVNRDADDNRNLIDQATHDNDIEVEVSCGEEG